MKIKKRYKKGSLLLEVFLGLVVLAIIFQQALVFQSAKKEQQDIEDAITKISIIVSYGIYDIFKGYSTAGGEVCSSGHDVKNISALRVAVCSKLPFETFPSTEEPPVTEPPVTEPPVEPPVTEPPVEPLGMKEEDMDGKNSYFIFLDRYAEAENGCKVYIDDFDDFTSRLLIDCSGLKASLHKQIEQKITKQLAKSLELIYKNSYLEAISFDELVGGTQEDGILILEFQK